MALVVGSSVPQFVAEKSLDVANVAATTVADQTFTVTGLRTDMFVVVSAASLTADLLICNAHCSANNTLKIRFYNPTGSGINPAAMTYKIIGL